MATQVQFRGGTTTEHASFNGAAREVTVDTTKQTLVVQDGTTNGGYPLMRENGSQTLITTGGATFGDVVNLPALKSLRFADGDFYLQNNNTDNYIVSSVGDLQVHMGLSQLAIKCIQDGATSLYYDASGHSDPKLSTNASGVVVNGYIQLNSGTGNTGVIIVSTDANAQVSYQDNTTTAAGCVTTGAVGNDFFVRTGADGSKKLTILAGGNVGIGDNTPSYKLEVDSGTTDVAACFKSSDDNAWIQFKDDGTTDTAVMIGAKDNDLLLRAGSDTRIKVQDDGRVFTGTGAIAATNSLVSQGGIMVSAAGATGVPSMCIGADSGSNSQTLTDNTSKDCRIGFPHYETAEEPCALITGFVGDGSNVDTNTGARVYVGGGTSWMNAANQVRIYTAPSNTTTASGTERMRVHSTGEVSIPQGITLGLQADDKTASNTLHDYEEGTWTPYMTTNGAGTLSATYTYQSGRYIKIGQLVYITWDMTVSDTPSGNSGYPQISGLPFSPVSDQADGGYGVPVFRASSALPADAELYPSSYTHSSNQAIWISYYNSSRVAQSTGSDTFWLSGRCQGNCTYRTTS